MVTVRRRGGDAAWFDCDCRRAFELKQSAYHRWCRNRSAKNWDLFCQARGTANRLYAAAKARYSADCRRNLGDCASANAWWRTLKGHVFGAESDIPPLCSPGGALVSDPAGKAELLSTWFNNKQSRDIVELPHFVALPLEHVRLSGTCWILIQIVEWTRLVASLCSFGRLLLFLLQN